MTKTRVPAIEGWFTMDPDAPHLLGTRCTRCSNVFFPKEESYCRNPECGGTEFEETKLSRRGRVWSFTNNCYAPPEPFMAKEPFEPYAIAAVELEAEKMIVIGQVTAGTEVGDLEAGMEMELVLDILYEDDENEYIVWKWQPAA
ncbi:MAG: Zn-ribbon domain-containing OB-fold protein [Deltaproteobacteria bacterium]|nr:Zn-ribbon domain-containing OB-fold protein [Deltaproteobacteria bacterium]MBW2397268.1 Zn-ribbon domain-containing OB-fold protein [Deltaproteobacteria bacterium]